MARLLTELCLISAFALIRNPCSRPKHSLARHLVARCVALPWACDGQVRRDARGLAARAAVALDVEFDNDPVVDEPTVALSSLGDRCLSRLPTISRELCVKLFSAGFNRRTIARERLEERVLTALGTRLIDPALFAVFCDEFTLETNRLRRLAGSETAARQQELARIENELKRLVQSLAEGMPIRAIRERLEELEERRTTLEADLAERQPPAPILHPRMAEVYRRHVTDLAAALQSPETRTEAAEILRSLVETIELRPRGRGIRDPPPRRPCRDPGTSRQRKKARRWFQRRAFALGVGCGGRI
jgi:hypothetical protein